MKPPTPVTSSRGGGASLLRSRLMCQLIAWCVLLVQAPPRRSERGLSQSTENAVLLAGAVGVAGLVIAAVTAYVQGKLPR